MGAPSLRKIAYHTLQQGKTLAGLAHKELSTKLTEVFAPEASTGSFPINKELIKEVRHSMERLERIDWQEAEAGIYPKSQLFEAPWLEWAKKYPLVWLDMPQTWQRRKKNKTREIPDNLKSLEKKPEAFNLLNIYSEVSKINLEKALKEMSGKEYSFVKNKLGDLLVSEICPVGKEINKLMGDKTHLLEILKKGSEKARIKAEENLKNIREKVGLI